MSKYADSAIPFRTRGNRRFLALPDLHASPAPADFVSCFPQSFEFDDVLLVLWFVEPE